MFLLSPLMYKRISPYVISWCLFSYCMAQCPPNESSFTSGDGPYTISTPCPTITATADIFSDADIDIQSGGSLTINFPSSGGPYIFEQFDAILTISGNLTINNGGLSLQNFTADPMMSIGASGQVLIPNSGFDMGLAGETNTVSLDLEGEIKLPTGTFNFYDDGILTGNGCYTANVFVPGGDATGFTGGACTPLPVELEYFQASASEGAVLLKWSTITEINNLGFEVEKSINGNNFSKIGFVPGFENSNVRRSYTYVDKDIRLEQIFYRLKQIDFDGGYEYSSIRLVSHKLQEPPKIYPTHVSNELHLTGSSTGKYSMCVSTMSGKIVTQLYEQVSLSTAESFLNNTLDKLPASLYLVNLEDEFNKTYILRFFKK